MSLRRVLASLITPRRGRLFPRYRFERDSEGKLVDDEHNFCELKRLFLDWDIIEGEGGPGTRRGDGGSWHSICHLVAAGLACINESNDYGWIEVGYDRALRSYIPIFTFERDQNVQTMLLTSKQGHEAARSFKVWGYVEGSSQGRISAKGVVDPPELPEKRQDYDRPATDLRSEGGKVWEHWCTTRNIIDSTADGAKVLRAYLTILSTVGGQFGATVMRGRAKYGHPVQLRACVRAGIFTVDEATWSTTPTEIKPEAQRLFYEADPTMSLKAIKMLPRHHERSYFMFRRSIRQWQPAQTY